MLLIISAGTDGKSKAATLQMGDEWKTKPERSKCKPCNCRWWAYKQSMKECLLLLLLASFAVPCLAQSTNAAVSSESAQVQAWSQLLLPTVKGCWSSSPCSSRSPGFGFRSWSKNGWINSSADWNARSNYGARNM